MQYGTISGIDKPISRLIQGTVMVTAERLDESFALLDGVLEAGGNTFDTAHVYGGGDNERTVGRWVRERGVRDQVVILGKGAHPYDGRNRVTPQDIAADISDSLERFGFEQIDLYVLHRDDESVPVGEIVDALDAERWAGRIGAYGGSNWSHQRIAAANDYAAHEGKMPFAVSSPQFGLAWPQTPPWDGCITVASPDESAARNWYRTTQLPILPWSSLGGGIFSGKYTRENGESFQGYFEQLCVKCYGHEENFRRFERAKEVGERLGATPAQVALAWVFRQGLNVFPLVGSGTSDEFRENSEAFDVELSDADCHYLESGE